jgi:hypothetical protein
VSAAKKGILRPVRPALRLATMGRCYPAGEAAALVEHSMREAADGAATALAFVARLTNERPLWRSAAYLSRKIKGGGGDD